MLLERPFSRALLVEDEPNLATTLSIAMKRLEIPCDHAGDLKEATRYLAENNYDLVLLDRMLPDGDGVELCSLLRHQHFPGVILFLTALGEVEQRVKGLDQGADDYLPKPFSMEELSARIRALSRRKRETIPSRIWRVDEQRLEITSPDFFPAQPVVLTPLEFKLMNKLIHSKGEIVSRDELLKEVWGVDAAMKTRTVDLFIARLRKLFEATPDDPKHILTVRGVGYRFVR